MHYASSIYKLRCFSSGLNFIEDNFYFWIAFCGERRAVLQWNFIVNVFTVDVTNRVTKSAWWSVVVSFQEFCNIGIFKYCVRLHILHTYLLACLGVHTMCYRMCCILRERRNYMLRIYKVLDLRACVISI